MDFNQAKTKLRANFAPITSNADVKQNAKQYGFADLLIVPYVEIMQTDTGVVKADITQDMLDEWCVSERSVFDTAMENIENDVSIFPLGSLFDDIPTEFMPPIYVVTNTERINGAIQAIFARQTLDKLFPKGYVLLPSSKHEMIAVPLTYDEVSVDQLRAIVVSVNASMYMPEKDFLSNEVYTFGA